MDEFAAFRSSAYRPSSFFTEPVGLNDQSIGPFSVR
jgi:hypothetical protein